MLSPDKDKTYWIWKMQKKYQEVLLRICVSDDGFRIQTVTTLFHVGIVRGD